MTVHTNQVLQMHILEVLSSVMSIFITIWMPSQLTPIWPMLNKLELSQRFFTSEFLITEYLTSLNCVIEIFAEV